MEKNLEWSQYLWLLCRDIGDVSFDDSLPIERRGSLTSMISMTTTMTTDSSSSGGETNRVSRGTQLSKFTLIIFITGTYSPMYTGCSNVCHIWGATWKRKGVGCLTWFDLKCGFPLHLHKYYTFLLFINSVAVLFHWLILFHPRISCRDKNHQNHFNI